MTVEEFKEIDQLLQAAPCSKLLPEDNCKYNGYICFKCQAHDKLKQQFLKTNTLHAKIKSFFNRSKATDKKLLLIKTLNTLRK